MVYPNPGCACLFLRSEEVRENWPKLKHLPRPEPRRQTKDHDYWKDEYKEWKHLTCDQRKSYFCRKHGMWVTCVEVTPERRCPSRHYQMQQLLEGFYQQHEGAGQASDPSNSAIQGASGSPGAGLDEMVSGMDSLSVAVEENQDEDTLSYAQHGLQHQNQQHLSPSHWSQGSGHSPEAYATTYNASAEGTGYTYEGSNPQMYSYPIDESYQQSTAEDEYPTPTMRGGYNEDTKHRQSSGDKTSSKMRESSTKGFKGGRSKEGWSQGGTENGPTSTNYPRPSGTAQSPEIYQPYPYRSHSQEQHSAELAANAEWYAAYHTEITEERPSGKNRSQSEKKNRKR